MRWQVRVLGRFEVAWGDQAATRFESRKVAALLARVALSPARVHPREELAALLWPDADRETGLARLRHALSSLLRQIVPPGTPGDGPLLIDRHGIRARPGALVCDATQFETLVRQGRIDDALSLYAGELMPGYIDEWIDDERIRLAALFDSAQAPVSANVTATTAPLPAASRPVRARPALPGYLSGFVGRVDDLAALIDALGNHRLVTLLGPGGCGKTRLAVEIGRHLADSVDTIAFVALAECADAAQIPDRARAALRLHAGDVHSSSDQSPLEQIASALDGRTGLLILDNVEQLVAAGASLAIEAMLAAAPELRVLATSRRALGVVGEQLYALAPLPTPSGEFEHGESALGDDELARIAAAPSVALFLQRASAARPGFALTARNGRDLAALCRSLEGLPLALELAASRVRALSLSEMRRQWDDRFAWLIRTGAAADKEPRQRSLLATIGWSWRLLSPAQQRFLAGLSVFHGGCTANSAAFVCATDNAQHWLEALTDDSLLVAREDDSGAMRFFMLDMVRAFAAEQLPETDRLPLRERHRHYFREVGDAGDAENIRAALVSAIDDAAGEDAYTLLLSQLDRWVEWLGAPAALSAAKSILDLPSSDPARRLRVFDLASSFAELALDAPMSLALSEMALVEADDNPALRALALSGRARVGVKRGEPDETVASWLHEALALARTVDDKSTQGAALRRLGILAIRSRAFGDADAFLAESQQLFEAVGDGSGARYALDNRARAASESGDTGRAKTLYEQCLWRARDAGDAVHEARILVNLATVHAAGEEWSASVVTGREGLRLAHEQGNLRTMGFALWNLPEALLQTGHAPAAAALLGFAERYWLERIGPLSAADNHEREQVRARLIDTMGELDTETRLFEGARLSLSDAIRLALDG